MLRKPPTLLDEIHLTMEFRQKYNSITTMFAECLKFQWNINKIRLGIQNMVATTTHGITSTFEVFTLCFQLEHSCKATLLEYQHHAFKYACSFMSIRPVKELGCTICELCISHPDLCLEDLSICTMDNIAVFIQLNNFDTPILAQFGCELGHFCCR